eukprot:TRINITY_DN745_c0_g1_i4.p1 TRINITY_DN745_c0_g1~~TRINITY_DN745_c0_g1_i4.p1  ORF type:complete len:491 (-),score=98.08 TRINITY_DN745_c0_g1_i4:117-1589(-)
MCIRDSRDILSKGHKFINKRTSGSLEFFFFGLSFFFDIKSMKMYMNASLRRNDAQGGRRTRSVLLVAVALLSAVLLCLVCESGSMNTEGEELRGGILTDEFVARVREAYAHQLEGRSEDEVNEFSALLFKSVTLQEMEKKSSMAFKAEDPLVFFNCTPYGPSATKPTSVNALRPGDIDVVAALGDSITAAFGALASSIFTVTTQYRGVSWCIGGDDSVSSVLTVPNALRQYNPNVVGFSLGTGKQDSKGANLNAAVSGAVSADLPAQAQALIDKMKADSSYDFDNSWKLLTIFIGGNDLCKYCQDTDKYSPSNYGANLEATLNVLLQSMPKVLVNLVPVVDVTRLAEVSSGLCTLLHPFECPCGTGSSNEQQMTREAQVAYVQQTYQVAALSQYSNNDQFAVVVQPFLVDTDIPRLPNGEPDPSYFAPDCFHFSGKAHAAAAVGLWNNMFEPVSQKKTSWVVSEPFECPPEGTFIVTNSNTNSNTNSKRH